MLAPTVAAQDDPQADFSRLFREGVKLAATVNQVNLAERATPVRAALQKFAEASELVPKLPAKQRDQVLYGTGERRYKVRWVGKTGEASFESKWEGAIPRLLRRFRQTGSERAKRWYAQFLADSECHSCKGTRLRLTAEGADERTALDELTRLVEKGIGEEAP